MGIKVKVKRLSCIGSCLNQPIVELKWSREERVYDLGEIEDEITDQSGGNGDDAPRREYAPVPYLLRDAEWSATPSDNALALERIAVSPADEMRLEADTARLIDKTA